ncbi:hypothetical protein CLF_106354 [Clonorchis sinensis]|uniref:Laminin G domain-containing protein n=1 Tax=Clonorchis sinensis TaxID=79923 RepID=G7YF07_CLOSI|nr:hypothetical protein CLF_106354 [Clonorchis sinensis]
MYVLKLDSVWAETTAGKHVNEQVPYHKHLRRKHDVNWDITYLLNRRYEIARADEDFPIVIQPPADGTLYHVPAMRLFPDAQLPNDTFFIHMLFKPQKELLERGVYLFSIRDPDNTLRLSLQVVHRSAYQVVLTYNPVESVEGEKSVDFSVPWTDAYWHLGIHFEQNQTKFYTSCSDTETVPYHTVPTTGILGTRLFRDGATFFALNSGLQSSPEYYVCKCYSLINVLTAKLELLSKALTDANTKNAAIWTKVDKEDSSLNEYLALSTPGPLAEKKDTQLSDAAVKTATASLVDRRVRES